MDLDAFDFDLPADRIALRPARPRSAARLLVADGAATHDARVADLGRWLRPGDLLVFNDTAVIPARLHGHRHRPGAETAPAIEATLIRRLDAATWVALARPGKRLAPGDRLDFQGLGATVRARRDSEVTLAFDATGADLDASLAAVGTLPLPPYIARARAVDAADTTDYQTVFATHPGAVAAPTAALHFDDALLADLAARGVTQARLTLHVGAGTFLPVKTSRLADHTMHAEWGEITPQAAAAINAARAAGGRIIAVGTTVLRLLESAVTPDGRVQPWRGDTAIFLTPGHRFRAIDGLMTNFHLPRSTLFVLVAALMGLDRMQALYAHAIAAGYRFYSYGDASLLLPDPANGPPATSP